MANTGYEKVTIDLYLLPNYKEYLTLIAKLLRYPTLEEYLTNQLTKTLSQTIDDDNQRHVLIDEALSKWDINRFSGKERIKEA